MHIREVEGLERRSCECDPNERHTVWVDQEGFFHGRVDYWQ